VTIIPVGSAAHDAAVAALTADGLIVVPTDTVYGIAGRGPCGAALLAAAKGRSDDQPIALLVGSLDQAAEVAEVTGQVRAVVDALWPGPLTLVLPRRPGVDWHLGGRAETVGVRWPAEPFVAELARSVGPLAVTSANLHGEPPPTTAAAAAAALLVPVDLVVDGGRRAGAPSTVVELTAEGWTMLRAGAISEPVLEAVVGRR
jgi:tRNA threonylcarbamoyl adenosine modification protein (Sua5/YciO/YrdC/YwlC family)